MSTTSTSHPKQFSLPETVYENLLRNSSIEPQPEMVAILKKIHLEQLTTGLITASLKESAKPPGKSPKSPVPKASYGDFYTRALTKDGLIPTPALINIVERAHMERLTPALAIKAYVEFRNRFPQGCESRKEGESS